MISFRITLHRDKRTLTPRKDLEKMIHSHGKCRKVWTLGHEFPELQEELIPALQSLYNSLVSSTTKSVIHPRSLKFLTGLWRLNTWAAPLTTATATFFTGNEMELVTQETGRISIALYDIVCFKTTQQALLGEIISLLKLPVAINMTTGQCSMIHTPAYTRTTVWILERFTSDIESSLMDFNTPKVGYCSPKLLSVGTPEKSFPRDAKFWLNNGLGFVPTRKPFTIGDVANQLSVRYEWHSSLIASLMDTPSPLTDLSGQSKGCSAKGFTPKSLGTLKAVAKDYMIKPADKGGRVVVMGKPFYINAINSLLDTTDYASLNPGSDHKEIILKKGKSALTLTMKSVKKAFLTRRLREILRETIGQENRLGIFYGLPKVHKSVSNPPVRPVVSQINHPTAPLARFIDAIIQPALFRMNPHLLKSTHHALEILKTWDTVGLKFISFDVKSLYTSIPLDEGLAALRNESSLWDLDEDTTKTLNELTPVVLHNNVFTFEKRSFIQLKGVAMGSPLGPTFANTFMLGLDRIIMNTKGIKGYLRYIDDILILADSNVSPHDLCSTMDKINPSIKFELVESGYRVDFLDLTLDIHGSSVSTTLYEKDISSWDKYIASTSLHESNMLSGVGIGAMKRS